MSVVGVMVLGMDYVKLFYWIELDGICCTCCVISMGDNWIKMWIVCVIDIIVSDIVSEHMLFYFSVIDKICDVLH